MEGRKQCDEMTLRDAQRTASDDVRNRQAPGRRADGRDGGGRGGRDGGRRGGPGGPGGRRGGPGGGGPGGGGRFQAGGHADSVSIGSERPEAGAAPAAPAAPQG
jgi:translation initiation factor IF-2